MYPARPSNTKQKALAGIVVVAAITLITGGVHAYEDRSRPSQSDTTAEVSSATTPSTAPANSTAPPATVTSNSTASSASSGYKDGTYTASSDYFVPNGDESIKVTLTVQSGVVTASRIANSEGNPESASYQQDFAASYKSYVVGKKLNTIRLSYVAGASDTTQGFNKALATIESQAQA